MFRSMCTALLKFDKSSPLARQLTTISDRPWLMKQQSSSSHDSTGELQDRLLKHGIPEECSSRIAANFQSRALNIDQLEKSLYSWSALQLGGDRLVSLLQTHPNLLLLDEERIFDTHSFLATMFTLDNVYKIIYSAPQVFNLRTSEVSRRLDFLLKDMNARNAEVVNSQALCHPLHHLRTRYEFLLRCGVYKKVSGRADDRQFSRNPNFIEMFDTDDDTFACRVARLTPLEYQTFVSLYREEIENEEELESDDEG